MYDLTVPTVPFKPDDSGLSIERIDPHQIPHPQSSDDGLHLIAADDDTEVNNG